MKRPPQPFYSGENSKYHQKLNKKKYKIMPLNYFVGRHQNLRRFVSFGYFILFHEKIEENFLIISCVICVLYSQFHYYLFFFAFLQSHYRFIECCLFSCIYIYNSQWFFFGFVGCFQKI